MNSEEDLRTPENKEGDLGGIGAVLAYISTTMFKLIALQRYALRCFVT